MKAKDDWQKASQQAMQGMPGMQGFQQAMQAMQSMPGMQGMAGMPGMDFMKGFGEWTKGWQTLAAEMTDYSKRSFEESTATFEKLLSAKSLEQAVEIQTSYQRRAYDEFIAQATKIGSLYAGMAKDAYRPFDKLGTTRH